MRALFLALALVPAASFAQNWSIAYKSGSAVMDTPSVVYFTVTNNAGGTQNLDTVKLSVNAQAYDIEGGVAPVGWVVSTVDRQNRGITFKSTSSTCPRGLAPGQSAVFGFKLIGASSTKDVPGDTLVSNKTSASNSCTNVTFNAYSGTPTWTRVGLGADLYVSPRTLDQNGTVTVTMTVTNHSSASQSAITPFQPTLDPSSTASFGLTSGPSPSSLTLAADQSGTFTWTFIANTRGLATFKATAQNASVTSEQALSLLVNVGEFPGMVSLTPFELGIGSQVTSGTTVTLSLTVSNNSSVPFENVQPNPPTFSGTASASLVSGPTPSSVANLSPGGSTRFTWKYVITGTQGDTFQFTTQGIATKDGLAIATDPVGSAVGYVVSHTMTGNPAALASGSAAGRTIAYTISNGGTQNITKVVILTTDPVYFPIASNPYANDTSGWTTGNSTKPKGYGFTAPNTAAQIPPGGSKTFTLTFNTLGTVTLNTTVNHRASLVQTDGTTVRVETDETLFIMRTLPEVASLGVVSTNGQNTVVWNNPSDHDGTLVLRAVNATPNLAPTAGVEYSTGATLGNATVVYKDSASFSSSFTDSGLTNGTKYVYKVYNHDEYFVYSAGNVPSSSGIFGIPTSRTLPSPLWCYTFGFPSSIQPVTELGATIFTASNAGTVTANVISNTVALDGQERWRPAKLNGAVQGRFIVTTLSGNSGKYIVVGDQSGYAYAINSATGGLKWKGFGGVALGNAIQAQPAIQLNSYANAAFQAAHPGMDLVFFATRNTSTTNNRVYALSSVDGTQRWVYSPGNLDIVSGGMFVDYTNNRLWVGARSAGGTQASIRVINTLNGAEVAKFSVGDVDLPINLDYSSQQAYVTTNAGAVYGFDVNTVAQVWTYSPGAMTAYAAPIGNGFIASLSSGQLQQFHVDPTTHAVTALWATPPTISGPTGIRIEYNSQKLYVGDNTGKLHQIDVNTGVDEKQVTLSTSGLGTPTIDYTMTPMRLHVGTLDGRICAVQLPF